MSQQFNAWKRKLVKVSFSELKEGLIKNFNEVSVEVKPCPDLTKAPFNLASRGNVPCMHHTLGISEINSSSLNTALLALCTMFSLHQSGKWIIRIKYDFKRRKHTQSITFTGLTGNTRILDIGGVPYLVPLAQVSKLYDMKDFPKLTNFDYREDVLILGAAAAPWTHLKRNAEVCFVLFLLSQK